MTPQSNNSHNDHNTPDGTPGGGAPAAYSLDTPGGSQFVVLTIGQQATTPNTNAVHDPSTPRPSSAILNSGFYLASQPSFIYATPLDRRAVFQVCHDELLQIVSRQREAYCRQIVSKEAEAKSQADNEERDRNEQVEKNFVNSTMIRAIELLGSDNPQDQQVASVLLQLLREQQQTGAHVGANQTSILRPSSARRNLGVHMATDTATQAIMIFGWLQMEARIYFDHNASCRQIAYECAEAKSRNAFGHAEAKSRNAKKFVTSIMDNIMKLQESENPHDRQVAVDLLQLLREQQQTGASNLFLLYLKNYMMMDK